MCLCNLISKLWVLFCFVFLIFNYVFMWDMCTRVLGAHGGQKRASDPLGPGLRMAVSHYVGAGSRTLDPWKNSHLNHGAISLALAYILQNYFC